jgi:hypothetical protein
MPRVSGKTLFLSSYLFGKVENAPYRDDLYKIDNGTFYILSHKCMYFLPSLYTEDKKYIFIGLSAMHSKFGLRLLSSIEALEKQGLPYPIIYAHSIPVDKTSIEKTIAYYNRKNLLYSDKEVDFPLLLSNTKRYWAYIQAIHDTMHITNE